MIALLQACKNSSNTVNLLLLSSQFETPFGILLFLTNEDGINISMWTGIGHLKSLELIGWKAQSWYSLPAGAAKLTWHAWRMNLLTLNYWTECVFALKNSKILLWLLCPPVKTESKPNTVTEIFKLRLTKCTQITHCVYLSYRANMSCRFTIMPLIFTFCHFTNYWLILFLMTFSYTIT